MVNKKKSSSGSTIRRARTPEQQLHNLTVLLTKHRNEIAKKRLKLETYLDKKWLSNRGNYDYYLFDIQRTLITRRPNLIAIFTGNIFKPKMRDKALLYMNELVLYGHMCFNDYKTYPAQVLKDMGSNIKTIQKEIKLVMRKIEEQQVVKSKKKEIGTKFVFGLASGLPHLYHNVLWEELDTMKIQFEELEKLVIADKELKHKKTKTNFLGKIQYYLFLCREIFKMTDFSKFPEVNTDNYDRYLQGFYLRILQEIPDISETDQIKILNSIKLRPADQKKYGVNKFVNLMGCSSSEEYKRLRKLINF